MTTHRNTPATAAQKLLEGIEGSLVRMLAMERKVIDEFTATVKRNPGMALANCDDAFRAQARIEVYAEALVMFRVVCKKQGFIGPAIDRLQAHAIEQAVQKANRPNGASISTSETRNILDRYTQAAWPLVVAVYQGARLDVRGA